MKAVLQLFTLTLSLCIAEAFAFQSRDWGTYYGGELFDFVEKVTTDQAGNVYIVGTTESTVNIIPPNKINLAHDPSKEGFREAFIAKFNSQGVLQWATYYGDTDTRGEDIGVDGYGNVYVLGVVVCPSQALASPRAYDTSCEGNSDLFLVKFNSNGNRLWGTYFGGNENEDTASMTVVPTGTVYLIGRTGSSIGVVPQGMLSEDATLNGLTDAMIAKFSAEGKLLWSRYFGGDGTEGQGLADHDFNFDIACKGTIGGTEICYISGHTPSNTGIATNGAWDTTLNSPDDAFLAQLNGSTGKVFWSTYYGGNKLEVGGSVVIDNNFNVYISGSTYSTDALASQNAWQAQNNGGSDIFLARFNPNGVRQWGTFFGSSGSESLHDLAIDTSNNLYLAGTAFSNGNNLTALATPNVYDGTLSGTSDAILAKFNQVGIRVRTTYYGGAGGQGQEEKGSCVAVDAQNKVYLGGFTTSMNAIGSLGAHQPNAGGPLYDGMLIKFSQ